MRRMGSIIVLTVCAALVLSAGCTKSETLPDEEASAEEGLAPMAIPPPVGSAEMPPPTSGPVIEGNESAKQYVAKKRKEAEEVGYQGEVVLKVKEQGIEYNAIKSEYRCTTANDCTHTKYANVPANDGDCKCAAACTPFVVNTAEAARREAANKKFCDQKDWYGPLCPAPQCNFLGFDMFKCIDGLCFGLAAGRK